jgi:two-component system, cell cycle sensor histidine kinase and response regulator CckA
MTVSALRGQLAESDARLAIAQAVGGFACWDLDLATGTTTWSDELGALAGISAEASSSYERFLNIVAGEDRDAVHAAIGRAVQEGGDFEIEFRVDRRSPKPGSLLMRGRAVPDGAGWPTHLMAVVMDVSERRKAELERAGTERKVLEAQKLEAVGRLAGGLAHDFNNLLLGVRGYADLALGATARGESPTRALESLVSGVDRAAGLTRQLLAFSRRQVLRPEILDLAALVQDTNDLLRRMIGDDIELETIAPPGPVWIRADRSQIEQVVTNLAVNAVARRCRSAGGSSSRSRPPRTTVWARAPSSESRTAAAG